MLDSRDHVCHHHPRTNENSRNVVTKKRSTSSEVAVVGVDIRSKNTRGIFRKQERSRGAFENVFVYSDLLRARTHTYVL